jgi:MFS family permease
LPSWLTSVAHLSGAAAFLPSGVAGLILTVGSPLSGELTDRPGRRKPILYVTGVAGVLVLYPVFALMLRAPVMLTILPGVAVRLHRLMSTWPQTQCVAMRSSEGSHFNLFRTIRSRSLPPERQVHLEPDQRRKFARIMARCR